MNYVERMRELADDRGQTLYVFTENCGFPYSTIKSAGARGVELSLGTIARCCEALEMPMYQFFMSDEDWEEIGSHSVRKMGKNDPAAPSAATAGEQKEETEWTL